MVAQNIKLVEEIIGVKSAPKVGSRSRKKFSEILHEEYESQKNNIINCTLSNLNISTLRKILFIKWKGKL